MEELERIEIKDIPIMITNRGEIVCIPYEDEVFSAAIIGGSGTGKTLLANRIQGSLHYQWKANVAIMNDLSEETYKWSEPMEYKKFNEFNEAYLNQQPIASPLVYVYPNTSTLFINKKLLKGKKYLKIVLPFKEIIEDLGFYLKGVSPDFAFGKSELYVMDLKEDLIKCNTPTEIRETLEEKLPGEDGKSFKSMRVKIMTAFNALMREEILDITNPEQNSYLEIREESFISNPFSVLMKAGVIPSFITSELITKRYKSEMISYYVNAIFNNHLEDFPDEKTFLFFDELKDICTKDDEPASKAIGVVNSRGRINNVGLIYATQFYNKIPNIVKGAKLTYAFSFQHADSRILNDVGSDFDLDRNTKIKIKHLNPFEVVAMTNNKFICYADGLRYEITKPIKGKIIFPFSNHLKSGKKR